MHRDGATTIIDILFKDVRAVELRAWTKGFSIREVDATSIANAPSRPDLMIEHGHRVYALRGEDWEGFVVAGGFWTAEDEKELWEPSPLIDNPAGIGIGIR
jgi:hypothetical protein